MQKTPVFTQALQIQKLNERNEIQCCVPLLLVALLIHELHTDGTITPYIFIAGRGTCSKQCLRAIRELKSVSWPQKGCCDYISQKLILLVVQHHGVSCVH